MKNLELVKEQCNAMGEVDVIMPFWDRKVTLICFYASSAWIATKSVSGKKIIIENKEKSDTFCCAWTGKYSSNIFGVTHKQLDKYLNDTK
jgi:hypothetical protein